MLFKRPVDIQFPISSTFGEWGPYWSKHMSPSGAWVPGQVNGMGQHKGVDFAVPINSLVTAMCDGLIIRAGWENINNPKQGFGQRVRQQIVTDSGSVLTLVYGHLQVVHVREGHRVVAGDRIGLSGNSGHSSGPHLHVELVDGKTQYHPLNFAETPQNAA